MSAHRALWPLGAPVRGALIAVIRVYQVAFSGVLGGGGCRFSPGCSRYAVEAIQVHGAVLGSALAIRRILRCNPFGRGGLDPVPPRRGYEGIIHRVRVDRSEVQRAR